MGNDIRIMTEAELRETVGLDLKTIDIVEAAFTALASGKVIMPPIMSMDLPMVNGEVDAKTAYIPGFDGFALKVSTGFYGNVRLGRPSLGGMMTLLSATEGHVLAVYLDNGYLTDLRTAAAGAVAARHMAPEAVHTAGVIGTGVQARLQMKAARLVRPFQRLLVWGRDAQKAQACADDLARDMPTVDVRVVDHPGDLVMASQLVITTTPAREPVLDAKWLHPGLHITAMGSDAEGKNEIDPKALAQADLYVADRVSQTKKLGELRSAIEAGVWEGGIPAELGQVITGEAPGRRSDGDITIADLTGTGAQDTAIASHVHEMLKGSDAGTVITA